MGTAGNTGIDLLKVGTGCHFREWDNQVDAVPKLWVPGFGAASGKHRGDIHKAEVLVWSLGHIWRNVAGMG